MSEEDAKITIAISIISAVLSIGFTIYILAVYVP